MSRLVVRASLVAALLGTPALAGDRLLVAGSEGLVMQADTDVGAFELFACQCAGPIDALAADTRRLFVSDTFGQVLVFDVQTGALQGLFFPDVGQINALAAGGGDVFAGTEEGHVVRIDPQTGKIVSARTAPAGVRALLAHDGQLFVGGADGAIYRAPIAGGDFEYFSCFCFFNIEGMVVVDGDLFIVDGFGLLARVDAQTGEILGGFFVGQTNSMAATKETLIFYYAGGMLPTFDAQTGQPLPDMFKSPVDVRTMLVLRDGPGRATQRSVRIPRLR